MPRKSAADVGFFVTGLAPGDRLRPPADLAGPEKRLFIEFVLSVRPGHFADTDAPLLAAYCRAVVLEKTASAGLQRDGHVVDGKVSPWLAHLQAATRQMTAMGRQLKLNPAARQAAKAEQAPISYYDRMALEHRDAN